MKSINYTLLVALSSFMLTACGGGESLSTNNYEGSSDRVAAEVAVPLTEEQRQEENELNTLLENSSESSSYRVANWIPQKSTTGTSKKYSKATPIASTVISSKMESDGSNASDWYVFDNKPAGATITSVYNEERGGNVISLDGEGTKNGYALGWKSKDWDENTNKMMKWNNTTHKSIKWSMNFDPSENYYIYVRVSTKYGYRYLYYMNHNKSYGEVAYDKPHYIHHGLGKASNDGTWRTFTRNLSADLKEFQPMNEIISVDGFFVRGTGLIDDVELLKTDNNIENEVTYEDGANSGWKVYTSGHEGTIESVNDSETSSKVIEFKGEGTKTGFRLGSWNNTINKELSWSMKYCEEYVVYISVETDKGHRFITYSPLSEETFASNPDYGQGVVEHGGYTYVHLGLNPNTKSCSWKTIARNLEADLKKYEPDNSLKSVNAFLIRGSGRVDNIKMFDTNTNPGFDPDTST